MENIFTAPNFAKPVLEDIDYAMYDWLDKSMNIFCNTKEGFSKVPVLWTTPERAYQIKNNKGFYDIGGTLKYPLISIERTSIVKDPKQNGVFYANIPPKNNRYTVSRQINQEKSSQYSSNNRKKTLRAIKFVGAIKKAEKPIYEYRNMLLPVYVNITYAITIITNYQQQMNEIIQPFITRTGSLKYFPIYRNNRQYECFYDTNIETQNNTTNLEGEERKFISKLTIKVLGNIASDYLNEENKYTTTGESIAQINLSRNSSVLPTTTSTTTAGGQIGGQSFFVGGNEVRKIEYIITPTADNTTDNVTRLNHYLNNVNVHARIEEIITSPEDTAPVAVVIDYYENYIDIQDLTYGETYIVTIT
jgi:hypothetical protein